MSGAAPPDHGGPWYRHPWPWFIVGLLGSTVVAGLTTVWIAVQGADALVVDDYYRDGKAINRSLAADREAALREAVARVTPDGGTRVALDILGDAPAALTLTLSHVTRAELDRALSLARSPDGRYASPEPLPAGGYYATLAPPGRHPAWRLRGRVDLPAAGGFVLEPGG